MSHVMRAAVARGPGAIGPQRVPRPEPGPGEVRVRVGACGICGSDLRMLGAGFLPPGAIPGHEFAGTVDALGAGVRGVAVGDAVAVEPFRSCGGCAACRAGRDPICREARLLGIHDAGGLAEWVVAPARRAFRVPAGLDLRSAALAEPLAVVVHGLARGSFARGQRVLVLGAGSIGLLTVLAARALGARDVWITARHPHQAKLAAELGATRVLAEAEADAAALDALGRRDEVDLVVETVGGSAETLRLAGAALRPGGAISVLGVFFGQVVLDALPLLLKEATVAWSYCYAHGDERADFADALALIGDERERLARVLTHARPLDDVATAFALAADRRAGAIKVSVIP
jgi:2-desacetyl-2-hydroxyethyl bacteriochlorophyllide A dehydrogenase